MIPTASDPFTLVASLDDTNELKKIGEKILRKERINFQDGVTLFEKVS